MQATVYRRDEGERIGGPTTVTIKATGEQAGGSFYLGEVELQPGFPGPPPHRHRRLHDMFCVLEGTLTVRLEDETLELGPVRILNFNTPAGWEDYMRDLAAALAGGTATQAEIGAIASRYDFEVA